jgi:hypothetical protein
MDVRAPLLNVEVEQPQQTRPIQTPLLIVVSLSPFHAVLVFHRACVWVARFVRKRRPFARSDWSLWYSRQEERGRWVSNGTTSSIS